MKDNIEVLSLSDGLERLLVKTEAQYNNEISSDTWRCGSLSTGYPDLDRKTGGIGKGLTVIAGRPLNHHEMFHRNVLENMLFELEQGKNIFHLELGIDSDSFYRRLLSSLSRVDYVKLESGQLDDEDWARISASMGILMEKQNLFIRNKSTYVEDIPEIFKQLELDNGKISVISISSIHNLKTKIRYESRYAEICSISKALKAMSIDLDICLIVGSNINRKCEERADKRPLIWDLRDSGTLEEDANIILLCYNHGVYTDDSFGHAEVIVAKNDFGGSGTTRLFCNSQFSRFDNFSSLVEI